MFEYQFDMRIKGNLIHYSQSFKNKPPRNQITLVFIHPLALHSEVWKYQWQYFKKFYSLVAVDLPCFGESLLTEREKPTPAYFQSVIARFLKKLNLPSIILLGNSLGGAISLSVYPKIRKNIRGIVLISALTKEGADSGFFKRLGSRINRSGSFVHRVSHLIAPIAPVKRILQILFKLTFEPSLTTLKEEGFQDYLEQYYSETETIRQLLEVLRYLDGWEFLDTILPKIKVPVLIVWGRKDKILPLKSAKLLRKKIVGSELVIMPDSGHMPYLEKPEEFNKQIEVFLNKCSTNKRWSNCFLRFFLRS